MMARASQYWGLWQEFLQMKAPNSIQQSWEQEFRHWDIAKPDTIPSGKAVAGLLEWYQKRSVPAEV
jgi:hypothetical protein